MNEPTPSRPASASTIPSAGVTAAAQQLLSLNRDTADMLHTVFQLTLLATQHAQQVVLPGATQKIKEMQDLLEKQRSLEQRDRELQEKISAHNAEKERHSATVRDFEAEKQKCKDEHDAGNQRREQQRYDRYTAADQLLLPSALRTDEAKSFTMDLIPILEKDPAGWHLRAAFAAVAVAEIGDDEAYLLITIQELFQPVQKLDSALDITHKLQRVLSKTVKGPILIEIPQLGAPYSPITMAPKNAELNDGSRITRVLKWGVKFCVNNNRKRALVA